MSRTKNGTEFMRYKMNWFEIQISENNKIIRYKKNNKRNMADNKPIVACERKKLTVTLYDSRNIEDIEHRISYRKS